MPDETTPKRPQGATRVYTLTIEATCTATVTVESKDAISAGKWLRDVAIPNQLVDLGKLTYDWTTAKATWDESAAPSKRDGEASS